MNKRQRKKKLKKEFENLPDEYKHCQECGEKLHYDSKYQMRYGTCDATCHLHLVGMSWSDFI